MTWFTRAMEDIDPLELLAAETNAERLVEGPEPIDETVGSIDDLGMILAEDVPVSRFFGQAMRVDQAFAFIRGERPASTLDHRAQRTRVLTYDRRFRAGFDGVVPTERFMRGG